jgi:hypothetical protein
VENDFAKVCALLCHGACASLAKSDAMALAKAFQNDGSLSLVDNESIAGHGAPSQTLTDREARGLRVIFEERGILR